ncbi:ComEC/Rec2 family competence protein [Natronincola ferrireducens]|uniref:Competence protein ComEC n=1 Tax=Natronincola ferrireducens TaxID=393762 RepID=A0A1G9BCC5_9FIRM|nr:ComEC/Rec2 family competence protein [Natronincola ferrireducens]SDK37109.1 competence protein ComEC [Natronincola ferrireducens]
MAKPFSILCISVVIGIILGYFISISITGYLLIALLLIVILGMLFIQRNTSLFIGLLFIIIGNFIFQHHQTDYTVLKAYPYGALEIRAKIEKVGLEKRGYREYDIEILQLSGNIKEITIKEKARLRLKKPSINNEVFYPGDIIEVKDVTIVEDFQEVNLEGYHLFLRGKGYKTVVSAEKDKAIKMNPSEALSFLKVTYSVRQYIEDFFHRTLEPIQGGILKSIMFGNQGYIDSETLKLFSRSGTAHIIAVSGLHIGVIALIAHHVLSFLKVGKKQTLLITMVILLFYSCMVDFPVSIMRASLMYYLYVAAYFLDRRYDAINSLMMIAFILLLRNPFILFSVSFQLSFGATLSILLFYPLVKELVKGVPQVIAPLITVTICAQLGTMAIMAYHFQEVSIIAPIANVFIVPVLVPLLAIAVLSIGASLVSVYLGDTLSYITSWILTYIYSIVTRFSSWSYASITIENTNILYVVIYYIGLYVVYLILGKYKEKKLKLEKE